MTAARPLAVAMRARRDRSAANSVRVRASGNVTRNRDLPSLLIRFARSRRV
jgi:hypothetical protein